MDKRIGKIMVYVAGPYRGKTRRDVAKNIQRAVDVGEEIANMGMVPMIPHAATGPLDGVQDDEYWLDATMEMMIRCDAVYMMSDWGRSDGARLERDMAIELGIPVFYFLDVLDNCNRLGVINRRVAA